MAVASMKLPSILRTRAKRCRAHGPYIASPTGWKGGNASPAKKQIAARTDGDTIAAVCTAPGQAAIAIVRVSGPQSLAIADRVLMCAGDPPSRRAAGTFVHGHVRRGPVREGDVAGVADEVIVLIFRAPHSYTREDVIEIQGHGGKITSGSVLRAVLEAGARMAEPGEFTRRAFLHGRLDLTQAEAVMDLITAASDKAALSALEQLRGNLTLVLKRTYDAIASAIASIEYAVEFDDGRVTEVRWLSFEQDLATILSELRRLADTYHDGHFLRDGARVVICGPPNAGKSTLMNRLLGRPRVIVHEEPGTTRDTIEEQICIHGYPVRLTDTAGLREPDCDVERDGIMRSIEEMSNCDLILYVKDRSSNILLSETPIFKSIPMEKMIIILNKSDLADNTDYSEIKGFNTIDVCLLNDGSEDKLIEAIAASLRLDGQSPASVAISERHRSMINKAIGYTNVAAGMLALRAEDELVLAITMLRLAMQSLDTILGKSSDDSVFDAVFSKFCIGK